MGGDAGESSRATDCLLMSTLIGPVHNSDFPDGSIVNLKNQKGVPPLRVSTDASSGTGSDLEAAGSSLSGTARVGNTSITGRGTGALHPFLSMVLAFSSVRSGVRG